jgi:hypothetical protein
MDVTMERPTPNDIAQIVTLARRAPLQNMVEAEAAAFLLKKLVDYFTPEAPVEDGPATEKVV